MEFSTRDLPLLNAVLNGSAALLLGMGLRAIRRKQVGLHQRIMLAALCVSVVFLGSYLTYHALHGSTRFGREGTLKSIYLTILFFHTVMAVVNLPLVAVTLRRALRRDFVRHRAIARWTWSVWMFVSVTGVVIYLMLYQIWPGPIPG